MTEQNGLERSSATDELRRLLDGRGVEWVASGTDTCWTGADGYPMRAWETTNGTHMRVADLTPEQAVEATLGRGTCRIEKRHMDWRCTGCSEIIGTDDPTSELFIDGNAVELWHFCPNCGRRVVGA